VGITVRDAMLIGGLTECKVIAGKKGLDREIEYVSVMEVPDVIQWLKGNDLLLTSLYAIKDNPSAIKDLVRQLSEKGSSGLALKTQQFIGRIPEIIISEGDRLQFPIIEINTQVSYLDIMTPLMNRILNKSILEHENLENFFKWITELAMAGKGIHSIVSAIEKLTGNMVTVESEIVQMEGITKNLPISPLSREQKNEFKTSKRTMTMTRYLNKKQIPCLVTPLILNEMIYSYITCWKTQNEFHERDFLVLERAIPLMALEFLKVKTKLDVEQTFKDDFLNDILSGEWVDKDEVLHKARSFGWDLTQDYQVFVIDIDHLNSKLNDQAEHAVTYQEMKRKFIHKVKNIFAFLSKDVIVTSRKDCIVVLYPISHLSKTQGEQYKTEISKLAETVQSKLRQEFKEINVSVGCGRCKSGLEGIYTGYEEAAAVIKIGRIVWERNFSAHFNDLGLYRILSQFHDKRELETIYAETVGRLVEYDKENRSNLLETLAAYFHCNGGLIETSKELFVHVNTIKYRLSKIEQLSGCRIQNSEERLWLHIGLKLHHMINSKK
jgi:PucR family transcriptional regulator, purine catabolism regulatory protein